jgi:hypothetical protein
MCMYTSANENIYNVLDLFYEFNSMTRESDYCLFILPISRKDVFQFLLSEYIKVLLQ